MQDKYNTTAYVYDLFDYPWENTYQKWRPIFVEGMKGKIVELGVGTGRNLPFYNASDVEELLAVDLSPKMIEKAKLRSVDIPNLVFQVGDISNLEGVVPSDYADFVLSSFVFCVLPTEDIQLLALKEIHRILKVGGKFRIFEIVFSKQSKIAYWLQWWSMPFAEWMYGARFDRSSLKQIEQVPGLRLVSTKQLSEYDTYLLIEGEKVF